MGQSDPAPEGVHYLQTTPDLVEFTSGQDQIRALIWRQMLHRWYADCCGAPLFNTMNKPRPAFASLYVARLKNAEDAGPVIAQVFKRRKNGKLSHTGLLPLMLAFLRRAFSARFSGRWRQTPFFDVETSQPISPPRILSQKDRDSVLPPSNS